VSKKGRFLQHEALPFSSIIAFYFLIRVFVHNIHRILMSKKREFVQHAALPSSYISALNFLTGLSVQNIQLILILATANSVSGPSVRALFFSLLPCPK